MSRGRMLFKLGMVLLLMAVLGAVLFMAPVQVTTVGAPGEVAGESGLPAILIGLAGLLVAMGMAWMILARRDDARRGMAPRKRKHDDEPEAYRSFNDLADLTASDSVPLGREELPELSEDDLFLSEEKPKRSENQD